MRVAKVTGSVDVDGWRDGDEEPVVTEASWLPFLSADVDGWCVGDEEPDVATVQALKYELMYEHGFVVPASTCGNAEIPKRLRKGWSYTENTLVKQA